MERINIFSCPIMFNDIKLDNKILEKFILNLEKKQKSRYRSNVGGWQSNDLSLDIKELNPLILDIVKGCFEYGVQQKFKNKSRINITNMWANVNGYKDMNQMHTHPHSMISGVYYVKCPKNCGDICFSHPSTLMEHDWPTEHFEEHIETNCINCYFPVIEGRLYLFPSWLSHKVMPNMNEKEKRISLSFNTELKVF
jgi:uncharacterized protein (TIGR02466 family)